jgi:hypothetical protein
MRPGLQGVGGEPPAVTAPLEQVQIDHTVIDLIVVDERDRQPIGRPYLTIAIDVFTRCARSAWSSRWKRRHLFPVGLCLCIIACDKRPWLEGLNIEMDWPMSGKRGCCHRTTAGSGEGAAPWLRARHPVGLSSARAAALRRHRGTDHRYGDADDPR